MEKPSGFKLSSAEPVAAREDEGQLVQVKDENGVEMFYTGQDGKPAPVTLRVAGTYSNIYRTTELEQQRRRAGKRQSKITPEQIHANVIELEAACILAWDGFFVDDAQTQRLELSPANARAVLNAARWIREQVEEAMNDHAGFTKSSATR